MKLISKISKFKAICECSHCQKHYECNWYDARKSPIGDLCSNCKILISSAKTIDQDFLRKVFKYDPSTGELRYRINTASGRPGELATIKHNEGYLTTSIGGKQRLAHRIIYMYMTGKEPVQIDHINHIRDDNRWSNLRNVQSRQNQLNTSLSSNNTTGHNGVTWTREGKYTAQICVNRKVINLGTFSNLADAIAARKKANKKYGFHPNHGV